MSIDYLAKVRERAQWYRDDVLLTAAAEFEAARNAAAAAAENAEAAEKKYTAAVAFGKRAAKERDAERAEAGRLKVAAWDWQMRHDEQAAQVGRLRTALAEALAEADHWVEMAKGDGLEEVTASGKERIAELRASVAP